MLKLKDILNEFNVAELLSDEELIDIGQKVLVGYRVDDDSRGDLKERLENAMKNATQVVEAKNEPWPKASNIKFPLIAHAANEFASREYPELIKDDRVVKIHVEDDGSSEILKLRADRVSRFMSYQLLFDSINWEREKDKALHVLPVVGTIFFKVYYDIDENSICSELCLPDRIVVNENTISLENARRITHEMLLYKNTIIEKQRSGIFCDFDLSDLPADENMDGQDSDPAYTFLEQHCYWDLDGDGYAEPYIITVHRDSAKVFAIQKRFKEKDIEYNKKGKIRKITPEQYFVDYHFFPSKKGGFHSEGWGQLLYPLTATIDTAMNQIIDSATLNNLTCGFLARGARIKEGDMYFVPGEWKTIDTQGQALQDVIMPLPTKEPSQTLFNTMNLLIEVGKEFSGLNGLNNGTAPGQNVPATTVLTLQENHNNMNEAIHRRLYKSLQKEFARIYELDREYVTEEYYQGIVKDSTASIKYDFQIDPCDIVPIADPSMSSKVAQMIKSQALSAIPGLQIPAVQEYQLEALNVGTTWLQKLLPPPPDPNAPPPPEAQKTLAEAAALQAKADHYKADAQHKQMDSTHKILSLALDASNAKIDAAHKVAQTTKVHADTLGSLGKTEDMAAKTAAQVAKDKFDALHEVHQSHFDNQIKVAQQMTKDLELAHKRTQATAQNVIAQQQMRHQQQESAMQRIQEQQMQASSQQHEQQMAQQEANSLQSAEQSSTGEGQ